MEKMLEKEVVLDEEWIVLIKAAKNLGTSTQEIRKFLIDGAKETDVRSGPFSQHTSSKQKSDIFIEKLV